MSADANDLDRTRTRSVRERYEVYRVGDRRVSVISDPENEQAWICSDHRCEIRP